MNIQRIAQGITNFKNGFQNGIWIVALPSIALANIADTNIARAQELEQKMHSVNTKAPRTCAKILDTVGNVIG